MTLHKKSFRGFKSNQPVFRVKITKREDKASGMVISKKVCSRKVSAGGFPVTNDERVKTFITTVKSIKIPLPPSVLLERIEHEKIKMKSHGTPESCLLWDTPMCWDNEDLLFSITSDILDNMYKKPARNSASNRPLNSFMAFRAYNSQFGYGLKQNILSSLLASAWHSHPEQQKIWDTFAQQFNFVKPKCGFVEWVDQRYERES